MRVTMNKTKENSNHVITVIVPVFKVEKYFKKCIDSIVNQTYRNLEIILVDDGSPDHCPEMCDEYAQKDNRIKVIHKINGGLSDARNAGIKKACGEYIGFVDSDDWIDIEMYDVLLKNILENDSDISICQMVSVRENTRVKKNKRENTCLVYNKDQSIKLLIEDKALKSYSVNKLYKRNLFEKKKFPENRLYEDRFIMHEVFYQAKKVVLSTYEGYYYFHRDDSISFCAFNKKDLDLIDAQEKITEFCETNYPELVNVAHASKARMALYCLSNYLKSSFNDEHCEALLLSCINEYYDDYMKSNIPSKHQKIGAFFIHHHYALFKKCYLNYFKIRGNKR